MAKVRRLVLPAHEERSTFQDIWGQGLDVVHADGTTGSMTPSRALQVSAVFGCVRILSENVATLPLDMFIRRDGVKRPYRPRPTWLDFNEGPWNKIDFLVQCMTSLLLDGNAYIVTNRNKSDVIQWVTLLDPTKVEPKVAQTGQITFEVQLENGNKQTFTNREIQHVRGMMLPGTVKGCSPIAHARSSIGLSLSSTEFGAAFFRNDARPSVTINVPGELTPTGVSQMKEAWNEVHRGAKNAHKAAILTEGATVESISVNPDDAQFLETRKFQVPDIARIFGVPAHLLAHADSPQFGSSIAEQNVAFVQHSLRPWVERIEAALSDAERLSLTSDPSAFVGLNVNGLMRGDYSSRINTNVMAVREGVLTINEARQMEDLPPVEWGNEPISVQVQEPSGPTEAERALLTVLSSAVLNGTPIAELQEGPNDVHDS